MPCPCEPGTRDAPSPVSTQILIQRLRDAHGPGSIPDLYPVAGRCSQPCVNKDTDTWRIGDAHGPGSIPDLYPEAGGCSLSWFHPRPLSGSWKTFLATHQPGLLSRGWRVLMDLAPAWIFIWRLEGAHGPGSSLGFDPEGGGCSQVHTSPDPFLEGGRCSWPHTSPDRYPEAGGY